MGVGGGVELGSRRREGSRVIKPEVTIETKSQWPLSHSHPKPYTYEVGGMKMDQEAFAVQERGRAEGLRGVDWEERWSSCPGVGVCPG